MITFIEKLYFELHYQINCNMYSITCESDDSQNMIPNLDILNTHVN